MRMFRRQQVAGTRAQVSRAQVSRAQSLYPSYPKPTLIALLSAVNGPILPAGRRYFVASSDDLIDLLGFRRGAPMRLVIATVALFVACCPVRAAEQCPKGYFQAEASNA